MTREDELTQSWLFDEMKDTLQDSRSFNFYRRLCFTIPESLTPKKRKAYFNILETAIAEVRCAKLEHRIKKTPGALFTFIVKVKCTDANINLGLKNNNHV